ncbi:ribonuclease HII [bacterium]
MGKKKKKKKTRGRYVLGHSFEFAAMTAGIEKVAGVDEAGRGPLAGPVVAAAVILSPDSASLELADSKKITPKKRERLYGEIIESALAYSIATVSVVAIDDLNIFRAAMQAMKNAVEKLEEKPGLVFVDGPKAPKMDLPVVTLKGGDNLCRSVAAASILAKVFRDRQMLEYEELYPGYGFSRHKGYGTKEHMEALKKLGASPIHRRSFGPVKRALGG